MCQLTRCTGCSGMSFALPVAPSSAAASLSTCDEVGITLAAWLDTPAPKYFKSRIESASTVCHSVSRSVLGMSGCQLLNSPR